MVLAGGTILAGALAFGLPAGRDVLVSSLLLVHITRPLQPGLLHQLTESPSRESVMFPGGGRTTAATLYRSARASGGAAVILIHGVNEQGKDDPRIVWLADLEDRGDVHLAITRVFQHVRPNFPALSVTSGVRTSYRRAGSSSR
jgi:hypothetical protein